ncbi:TonB-dependent receptor [Flavivirga sp. 57AJ16]|uniref:SusC/RagA family TonB-linked outer membrane protein n=1 Tax=Flavivirga sp. 57AJ16 TaxID=3025307 RepID=UPI00236533E9|nr:TonB-dependent receptor [Flavivirga sp. 57AJ16]MDD7885116.1 TonB-dependent receptor [Flavivirga sp. 57AJ16]
MKKSNTITFKGTFLMLLFICLFQNSFAQGEINISGTVKDTDGVPLAGANVINIGTANGASADFDGNFSLSGVSPNSLLSISYLGYKTQEIPVNGRTTINIVLEIDSNSLDEIVVIGYQSIRKSDLTGATSIIDPDDSNKIVSNSLAESLQGLTSGVTVRNGGQPGQNSQIEIRGTSSFVNSSPLYIIDGMIADANQTINNNDIESIQILKDASAAAIYGSRAANGVIIITTKSGKEGPLKVSLSVNTGVQEIPKTWDLMNNREFADMQITSYNNSGLTPPPSVESNFDPSINTDWQNEIVRTGNTTDLNISLSGGGNNASYFVSGSHFENKGVLIGRSFRRSSFRVNTQMTRGKVTFGENILFSNSNTRQPLGSFDTGNPFFDMAVMLPVIPVRGDNFISDLNPGGWGIGNVDAVTFAKNQVAVADILREKINYAKIVGNAFIKVDILEGLSYKFNAGVEASFDFSKGIRRNGITQFNAAQRPSFIADNRSRFASFLMEHTLNFNKSFGNHNFNGVIGISDQQTKRDFSLAIRSEITELGDQIFTEINSTTGTPNSEGATTDDYRTFGYLGRINYDYDSKYYLTLTGRLDKDSRFSKENRTGFFPSIAGSWRISKEKFFDSNWINDLKINASYGELGIVTLGSFDWQGTINNSTRAILGGVPQVGSYQASLVNPDLRWENRKTQNYGLETSLFDNSLRLSMAYYNTLSEDALVTNLPIAQYLGNLGGTPPVNAGSIRNSGFEFDANYSNRKKDFKWKIGLNFTTIKNRVEEVGNQGEGIDYIQTGLTRSKVGQPLGQWYLLRTDGIFQSQAEIDAHSLNGNPIQPFAQPGDIRFIDVNGDGSITDEDRDFSGSSPWPTLQTGLQFAADYKNFDLSLQFVGIFGNEIFNSVRRELDSYQNTNFRSDINPWTPTNTNTSDPRIGVATGDQGLVDNARFSSDRWLEDGSYIRLRNIQLGYNMNENLVNKIGMSKLRLYASAQNLFTITDYSGLDPDVQGNGILERGVDNGNWPSSRIFSIGLNVEF